MHLSSLFREQRERSGQPTTSARTTDCDARRVDVVAVREPHECVVAVVQWCGEWMLGCEAVVHRGDQRAQRTRQVPADGVILGGMAHDVTAAVDPEHRRKRARATRRREVEPDRVWTDEAYLDARAALASLQPLQRSHRAQPPRTNDAARQHPCDTAQVAMEGCLAQRQEGVRPFGATHLPPSIRAPKMQYTSGVGWFAVKVRAIPPGASPSIVSPCIAHSPLRMS